MKRIAGIAFALCLGCAGKAPPNPAGGGDGGDVDAGSGTDQLSVSGMVADYFTGNLLDTTIITTDGIDPESSATAAADGSYNLTLAGGSKLYLITARASYQTTRNVATTVTDMPVMQVLYALSESDVHRQYVSATGSDGNADDGFLVIQLERNDGTPLVGIAPSAIELYDETGSAAAGIGSAYFFGAVGDLDTTVVTSTNEGSNGARAALLNVPPGAYDVAVTFTSGMGSAMTNYTPVVVTAGGATLAQSGGTGSAETQPPPANPSFATDIYPRLQTAQAGGLGCANCHTSTGPAGANGLPYDVGAATTLQAIMQTTGVINTTTPASSLFLTMPLYETTPPQNHPNATFLDTSDPNYKLFLLWITQGTKP